MVLKKELRKILNSYLKGNVIIRERQMAKDVLEKKFFIESITLLGEIEDRRDFLEEEIGMDMSIYEDKFLQIIENLFKIHFSKEQYFLIQHYIYTVPTLQDWEGKIEIMDGKQATVVDFVTPEDLWNAVVSLKKTK
jgi:hypothetical protein